jgi:hypothetical protein
MLMATPATICANIHKQPTINAAEGDMSSYAYVYAPPSFGMADPNSAKLKAVKEATIPAMIIEKITDGPA